MMAEGRLADLVIGEDAPGPDIVTPEQAVEYARATGIGMYHAVGSCAMGPHDEDVVDARLRVRGVRGLRVVDASVFPAMPSGNTAAPTMALAWRARTSSAPRPDVHRRFIDLNHQNGRYGSTAPEGVAGFQQVSGSRRVRRLAEAR